MAKYYSKKFWIIFWLVSALFLIAWFFFWQFMHQKQQSINSAINLLPITDERKTELKTLSYFANFILKKDGQERSFMILFQNDMEIRPGGGYIGSFGILKIKDGEMTKLETHDLSNFDGRIPSTVTPPYPMKETLRIDSWKLRDSNFSPDFIQNAQKAEEFYKMGQGQENFDGIVAINAHVLSSFLEATGPVEIPGYSGKFDSENAILALEYQVEQGYAKQGVPRGDRKSIMNPLANEIVKKVKTLNATQKLKLAEIIIDDLNKKDIQLYFKDTELEAEAQKAKWGGSVETNWNGDYLMMVDANMGSLKSDYYIKRYFEYTVDLSKDKPTANLKITYTHTAKEKDWMTKDYLSYLRLYAPNNTWFESSVATGENKFGGELGKKYLGTLILVPLSQTKSFEFNYTLPSDIADNYNLLIQKQSGVREVSGKVKIIRKDGKIDNFDVTLDKDWQMETQK